MGIIDKLRNFNDGGWYMAELFINGKIEKLSIFIIPHLFENGVFYKSTDKLVYNELFSINTIRGDIKITLPQIMKMRKLNVKR